MTWRKVANRVSKRQTWEETRLFVNGAEVDIKSAVMLLPPGADVTFLSFPKPRHLTRAKRRRRERYDLERLAKIRASGVTGPIGYARHAARKGELCEIVMFSGLDPDAAGKVGWP